MMVAIKLLLWIVEQHSGTSTLSVVVLRCRTDLETLKASIPGCSLTTHPQTGFVASVLHARPPTGCQSQPLEPLSPEECRRLA